MAGLSLSMLLRMMPIQSIGQLRQTLDGLGIELDRAKQFLAEVKNESSPDTATETIDMWLDALGITVAASATLGEKRALAMAAYTATGGQNLAYIQAQINKAFGNVTITETDIFEYTLGGFYPYARDFLSLLALTQRICPAHLESVFNVRSVYDGDVARCGIGTVGRAICGRGETAYRPTAGTIARCGVGRIGLAVTGRTAVI